MKHSRMLKPVAKNLAIGRLVYDKGDQLVGAVSTIDSGGAFTVAILGGAYRWPGWMEGWNVSGITGISTLTVFELANQLKPERRKAMRRRFDRLRRRVPKGFDLSMVFDCGDALPSAIEYRDADGCATKYRVPTERCSWRDVRRAFRQCLQAIQRDVKRSHQLDRRAAR